MTIQIDLSTTDDAVALTDAQESVDRAVITLVYCDADGRLIDSEEIRISPDAGSVWIKLSDQILS